MIALVETRVHHERDELDVFPREPPRSRAGRHDRELRRSRPTRNTCGETIEMWSACARKLCVALLAAGRVPERLELLGVQLLCEDDGADERADEPEEQILHSLHSFRSFRMTPLLGHGP